MHLQDFNKSLVEHCYIYFFMIYLEKAIKEASYGTYNKLCRSTKYKAESNS